MKKMYENVSKTLKELEEKYQNVEIEDCEYSYNIWIDGYFEYTVIFTDVTSEDFTLKFYTDHSEKVIPLSDIGFLERYVSKMIELSEYFGGAK